MNLQLLPRDENDQQFVFVLFSSHKIKELRAENWPEVVRDQLCNQQFQAFEKSFSGKAKHTDDLIISSNSTKVGRLILYETDKNIQISYISILPEFQHRGFGRKILNDVIDLAEQKRKELSLEVSKGNPALNLYLELGFRIVDTDDLHFIMIH